MIPGTVYVSRPRLRHIASPVLPRRSEAYCGDADPGQALTRRRSRQGLRFLLAVSNYARRLRLRVLVRVCSAQVGKVVGEPEALKEECRTWGSLGAVCTASSMVIFLPHLSGAAQVQLENVDQLGDLRQSGR